MDDSCRLTGRDGYQLEHATVAVGPDREQPVLAVVVVLDESERIGPRMVAVRVVDAACVPRRSPPPVKDALTTLRASREC